MKKILAKMGAKPIVKGILKAADSALLGGLVHNIKEGTESHPAGKMDIAKAVGALIPIFLLIMLGLDIITIEELKDLISIF